MRKTYNSIFGLIIAGCLITGVSTRSNAQAFHKNVFLLSLSEGHSLINYTTKTGEGSEQSRVHRGCIHGDRDPIIIEYGISNHWGVGLTSGKDIFEINPADFYGFSVSSGKIKSNSNEFTIDGNYHFFVNKRLDLSVFTSLGGFSVDFKGVDNGDYNYSYKANGNIIRVGSRARYYFWRHLGVFGMVSSYAASCNTKNVTDNTVGKGYTTSINGFTVEMGVCYRFDSPSWKLFHPGK